MTSMTDSVGYIAALDVGTSSVRCQIFQTQKMQCISTASKLINLIYPKPGYVEIDPEELWTDVCAVIKQAILSARLESSRIMCLGISTQRASFTTWRKDSGKPFHNFITWKDLRSDELVQQRNASFRLKILRMCCYVLYLVSRSKRYLAGYSFKFTNSPHEACVGFQNVPELQSAVAKNNALYGTVDTWLMYKFSSGQLHITDISNVSATGLFDPFILDWSLFSKYILNIPVNILPTVVDNDFSFGTTGRCVSEIGIPISCIISDQSASMFGSCCFNPGDTKMTLGTGSFLDVNNKDTVHGSVFGLYPLIGWKLQNEIVYFVEGASFDTGSAIQWAVRAGIIDEVSKTSAVAFETGHNDGVHFIPAFSGLGPPFMDDHAATGFIGLKVTSTKNHMARAILESIVYRLCQLYNMMKCETNHRINKICVDGGVANNDFICQLLANILNVEVERPTSTEMTTLGVAFAAGLTSGKWKNKLDLKQFRTNSTVFSPSTSTSVRERHLKEFDVWLKAVDRFKVWYKR